MNFLFFFLFLIALTIALASMSMVVVGAIRIGIFESIGVLDQARSQADLFNAAVGAVVVSMTPAGKARSLMIDGFSLFNHVKIYDDPQAVEEIVGFIKEQSGPLAGK